MIKNLTLKIQKKLNLKVERKINKLSEHELKLLGDQKEETLRLIKEEAENFLNNQIESDSILLSKANNLLQILIALLVSLVGYIINLIANDDFNLVCKISIVYSLFILISVLILFFKIIHPKKIYLNGSIPSRLLDSEVLKDGVNSILKNRIYCLSNDIENNMISQKSKIFNYKLSISIILIGLLVIGIIVLL